MPKHARNFLYFQDLNLLRIWIMSFINLLAKTLACYQVGECGGLKNNDIKENKA